MVRLHGFPASIVFDCGGGLVSSCWTELFKLAGIKLKFSLAYHLQTDGQTNVVNCCLETYLRRIMDAKPKPWHKWLSWAELWYNVNYHSATQTMPFNGRDAPAAIRGNVRRIPMEEVTRMLADQNELIEELK